jgi:hypothetical protein
MSQHDLEIANQGFAAFRQDLNDALQALGGLQSGADAPTTTYANMFWYETDTDKLYIRNEDNDSWVEVLTFDQANDHLATIGATITLDGAGNMSLAGDLTVDTDTLYVDSTNNRVGIGTSSPARDLSVGDGTGSPNIQLLAVSGGNSRIEFGDTDDSDVGEIQYLHGDNAMLFHVNGSERVRIDSSGYVHIGTGGLQAGTTVAGTSLRGSDILKSTNTTSNANQVVFYNPNGVVGLIRTSGSSTAYITSSDYRLKENVTGITDGIERVKQLNPSRFNFIADADATVDGFLAHEAATVVPEAVSGERDAVDEDGNPDYQGIDQSKLVPLLTAALQEAIAKIETLETRLTALETNNE